MPRWDEPRQALKQIEGGEKDLGAAVHVRFGEPVEEAALGRGEGSRPVEGVQAFERERGPGTVANEALDARAVFALDAYGGVDTEPTGHRPL